MNYTTLEEKTSECHYQMQPPTGTGIVFLKRNILSLAKRELAKDKHIARERIDDKLHELISPPSKIEGAERGVRVVATSGSWPPELCFCFCYLPIVISPTRFVPETMMLYSRP